MLGCFAKKFSSLKTFFTRVYEYSKKNNNNTEYNRYKSNLLSVGEYKLTWMLVKGVSLITIPGIFSYAIYLFIKTSDEPYESVLYSAVAPLYFIPIYINIVFLLILSIGIIFGFRKFLPYKEKWISSTFSLIWGWMGAFTSGGFIFGIFLIIFNLLDKNMSIRFDIFTTVTGSSLAGTFLGVPVSLIIGLAKTSTSLYKLLHGFFIVPIAFILSWNIPLFLFNQENLLATLYDNNINIYSSKVAEGVINVYYSRGGTEVTNSDKDEIVNNALVLSKDAVSNIDQGYIFWTILLLLLICTAVFAGREAILRWKTSKEEESYVEYLE